jgi:predicted nucleotidyltransferase
MATVERDRREHEAGGASLRALVEQYRKDIKAVAARHNGQRVRLFGSVARGDERDGSDIDLLVDFSPESSLFDLLHLNQELEELLRRPVDVVSRGGLKARDRAILDEAIDL